MNIRDFFKKALSNIVGNIDDCSDEDLTNVLRSLDAEEYGYIKVSNYINAEKAMKFLDMKNRNKFFTLTKENNIKNKKVNNQPIGFHKRDIEKLFRILYGYDKHFPI